jgi:hypothetical protein
MTDGPHSYDRPARGTPQARFVAANELKEHIR